MLDIIRQNKIILGILVVVIVAFAWFGLSDREPSSTVLVTSESAADSSVAEQEILKLLLDMRSIQLNSSIFENPAFNSLQDFGREIIPEPVGRSNPFAPTNGTEEVTDENIQDEIDAIFAE